MIVFNELFYDKGLRFSCTRCSICCRFESGTVLLTDYDLERISKYLSIEKEEFIKKYCKLISNNIKKVLSLIEKDNLDCIFWENGTCSIYKQRPLQCSSFPFWQSNLKNKHTWNKLKKECPGIDIGTLHSRKEIEKIIMQREKEAII